LLPLMPFAAMRHFHYADDSAPRHDDDATP